jgi:putative NADH-flavin reductase
LILGATGSLGRHVLSQAVAAGHVVTAFVRTPSRLAPDIRERVSVHAGDLRAGVPIDLVGGQDALINCAGHVADGEAFVGLIDQLVTSVELLPAARQPVCWLLAGAAILDIDSSGRRGVDLPEVRSTYWPHRVNLERLTRSRLDWRLLCPGPMVDEPALGPDRLRVSLDALPVEMSAARALSPSSLLSAFASVVPQMIVPYADAAALMLANLDRGHAMSRHRVGLALPPGMAGESRDVRATPDVISPRACRPAPERLASTSRGRTRCGCGWPLLVGY